MKTAKEIVAEANATMAIPVIAIKKAINQEDALKILKETLNLEVEEFTFPDEDRPKYFINHGDNASKVGTRITREQYLKLKEVL